MKEEPPSSENFGPFLGGGAPVRFLLNGYKTLKEDPRPKELLISTSGHLRDNVFIVSLDM